MAAREESIKEITDFLKGGIVFEHILRNNPEFYFKELKTLFNEEPNILAKAHELHYSIECNKAYLTFTGEPIAIPIYNDRYEILFISDFVFKGFIERPGRDRLELCIAAALRIFTQKPSNIDLKLGELLVLPEIIDVMDKPSFEIWELSSKEKKTTELIRILQSVKEANV